jgi:hypothetical protein
MHRNRKCIQTSAVNLDRTAVRDYNAGENFQKRGFARTVLPDYSKRHKILVVLFTEEDLPEPVGW